jgi:hypothetical protein
MPPSFTIHEVTMTPRAALLSFAAIVSCLSGFATVGRTEEVKEPKKGTTVKGKGVALESTVDLDDLIAFNRAALFGTGKVTVAGDDVEILLDHHRGQIHSAFEGTNVADSAHEKMKGSYRKFIQYGDQKGGEKLLPGLCAIAFEEGAWVSKFRLGGGARVSFDMRVPNLLGTASNMKVRLNWEKGSGLETSFMTTIARVSGGAPKVLAQARDPLYKKAVADWFPRKGEAVHVEFGFEDENCRVLLGQKEVVAAQKIKDSGGRVGFAFKKVLFTIQNLKITGKLDREWCKEQLAALEKAGKLVTEKPPAPATGGPTGEPPAPPASGEAGGPAGGDKPKE